VLAMSLHGAETWTLKACYVRHLTVFQYENHFRVSRFEQWQQHLTSAVLRDRFHIEQISKIIMERCLCWLGHVGHKDENRLFCMER